MKPSKTSDFLLPLSTDDQLWELFHENSKLSKYGAPRSDREILATMRSMHEALVYEGYPHIALPDPIKPLNLTLDRAIIARSSVREMTPSPLALNDVATLLDYAYGVTRENAGTSSPRAFRVIPSAGALYPLELYFYSNHVENLSAGLYHYNARHHYLTMVQTIEEPAGLAACLVQPQLALTSSILFVISALFERSLFKYGERGYRFIMLEAGHLAQNFNLVGHALGLGAVNIGGFFDREIDRFMKFDGVTQSAIYLVALGKQAGVNKVEGSK
jgi:SagB-type dehydrogenase family enzyme